MKINIVLTLSKVLGFLIIILGGLYAFIYKNGNILSEAFFYASMLVATKTITQDINFTEIFKNRKGKGNGNNKYIGNIIFLAIVIAIAFFLFRGCDRKSDNYQNGNNSDTIIIYQTDTVRDTVLTVDTIVQFNKPEIVYVETPVYIDTNKVIKDYFVRRIYTDTIVNDSDLIIVTKETIERNKLTSIIVTHKNMRPTVINNTKYIITPESNHLYVGGFLNGSKEFLDYGPQIIYTKKRFVYNLGFGINNKSLYIGIGYKLK